VETIRRIGGHRRVGNRRRGRAAVLATGLVAAVALSSGAGAEAATPSLSFSGGCVLGLLGGVDPSPSALSVGPAGAVQVVNKASGALVVKSGNGQSVTLAKGDSTTFDYPSSDSVKTYTVSAKCSLVNVSGSAKVTVAATAVPPPAADPTTKPGAGDGAGGTTPPADGGTGGSDAGGKAPGGNTGGTGSGSTGKAPAGGPEAIPGAENQSGTALPPGFTSPRVVMNPIGTVPIGNVPVPAVPGAPGETAAPVPDLYGPPAQVKDGVQIKNVAAPQDTSSTGRMMLIMVAVVLFLGVGAAAVRAVRDARLTSAVARA
jgi:hypothetical protein